MPGSLGTMETEKDWQRRPWMRATDQLPIDQKPLKLNTAGDGSGTPVDVYRAIDPHVAVVFYVTPELHTDYDGSPTCYAPPAAADQPRTFVDGLVPDDKDIRNACDPHNFAKFVAKSFEWVGVRTGKAGATNIDSRAWLEGTNGFPVKQASGFYAVQTAMHMPGHTPVDATTVPFGIVSGLRQTGIILGDYGLAIRLSSGAAVPFMFCDSQGPNAVGVAEFSKYVTKKLGTSSDVFVMAFPLTSRSTSIADVATIEAVVRTTIAKLSAYKNVEDIANTVTTDPIFRENIKSALKRFGWTPAPSAPQANGAAPQA